MRTFSTVLIIFCMVSSPFAQGTIVPDFGNTFGQFSFLEFTQSVEVAEGYAVFNFFQTENEPDAVLLIDENGLIQNQVSIGTDSTYYEPLLFSDGNTLFLAGYEGKLPMVPFSWQQLVCWRTGIFSQSRYTKSI